MSDKPETIHVRFIYDEEVYRYINGVPVPEPPPAPKGSYPFVLLKGVEAPEDD